MNEEKLWKLLAFSGGSFSSYLRLHGNVNYLNAASKEHMPTTIANSPIYLSAMHGWDVTARHSCDATHKHRLRYECSTMGNSVLYEAPIKMRIMPSNRKWEIKKKMFSEHFVDLFAVFGSQTRQHRRQFELVFNFTNHLRTFFLSTFQFRVRFWWVMASVWLSLAPLWVWRVADAPREIAKPHTTRFRSAICARDEFEYECTIWRSLQHPPVFKCVFQLDTFL